MHYTIQISQRLKKLIRSLHQIQFRDQNDLFLAEGLTLSRELLVSDFIAELIVIKDSPSSNVIEVVDKFADNGIPIYSAPKHQFDQMCNTKTPQGILAVINKRDSDVLTDEPFIALDGISDPGNVGTIIRTADWFGFKQVILGTDCADQYNPKVVRASMGSIFRQQILHTTELPDFIKNNFKKFRLYGASIDGDKTLKKLRAPEKYGLIFGNETKGIAPGLKQMIDSLYNIEGIGKTDSLNVAIAAGISLYHFAKTI